jgi:hypothetical protein
MTMLNDLCLICGLGLALSVTLTLKVEAPAGPDGVPAIVEPLNDKPAGKDPVAIDH